MKIASAVFVVVVVLALTFSTGNAQTVFTLAPRFTNLGSVAQAVDDGGVVVGYDGGGSGAPLIWRPSGNTYLLDTLPFPSGQSRGAANSIGAGGAIVGYTHPNDPFAATATVWTAPPGGAYAATALPSPADSTLTSAFSVNAAGTIGGFRETASGHTDGVVWTDAGSGYSATLLPVLPDWVDSAATAINDNGDVAGYSFAELGGPRGAVWQKTPGVGYVAKDVIAAADDVVISAINNSGTGGGVVHGDQAAVMVLFEGEYYAGELDVPFGSSDSAANAVNDADGLAGYVKDPTTAQSGAEAALWLPTDDEWGFFNLDAWLNQSDAQLGAQWTLMEAFGLSDTWLVTGYGMFDADGPSGPVVARERGFVLDASSVVPEPASAAAVALLSPASLRRRRSTP